MKCSNRVKSPICLLLCIMMVLALAACGGTTPSQTPSQGSGTIESSGDVTSGDSGGEESGNSATNPDGTPVKTSKQIFDDMAKKMVAHFELNDDTVGWLAVPGTNIDEVVVQAPDNDYYLRRNNLKKNEYNGCYFADFRVTMGNRSALSRNVVVYGHSMDDNPDSDRFSQLKKYLTLDYCKEHPYVYFITTESDNMLWQVFAVFYTDINFQYHTPNPANADYLNIITEARRRSLFNFDIDVGVNDTILTLSTCTYQFDPANRSNYRYVVMAKLLPAGSANTTPVKVEANPSPKAP